MLFLAPVQPSKLCQKCIHILEHFYRLGYKEIEWQHLKISFPHRILTGNLVLIAKDLETSFQMTKITSYVVQC